MADHSVSGSDLLYACTKCGAVYMAAKAPVFGARADYQKVASGCPVCKEDR